MKIGRVVFNFIHHNFLLCVYNVLEQNGGTNTNTQWWQIVMNLFNCCIQHCHTAAWQKKFLTCLGTDHLTYMGREGVKLFPLEPDKFSQMKLIQIIPYVDTCKISNFFSQILLQFLIDNCRFILFIFCIFQVN